MSRHGSSSAGRLVIGFAFSAALCALFVSLGSSLCRAQQPDFGEYARIADHCQGDLKGRLTLSANRRILCFDGWITSGQNISLANNLEDGGYFVVRGKGTDAAAAIKLAIVLGERHAIVVVHDYCPGTCADYLLIASAKAFVLKGTLVAWTLFSTWHDCKGLDDAHDTLNLRPCNRMFDDRPEYVELAHLKDKFYTGKLVDPPSFLGSPASLHVQRALKNRFEETGQFPQVFWTWNPRYYSTKIKTQIIYEAYPHNQDEVDAMADRIHLHFPVIYDP